MPNYTGRYAMNTDALSHQRTSGIVFGLTQQFMTFDRRIKFYRWNNVILRRFRSYSVNDT